MLNIIGTVATESGDKLKAYEDSNDTCGHISKDGRKVTFKQGQCLVIDGLLCFVNESGQWEER